MIDEILFEAYTIGLRDGFLSVLRRAREQSPEAVVLTIAQELSAGNYADNPHVKHWLAAASTTTEKPE